MTQWTLVIVTEAAVQAGVHLRRGPLVDVNEETVAAILERLDEPCKPARVS